MEHFIFLELNVDVVDTLFLIHLWQLFVETILFFQKIDSESLNYPPAVLRN